jgi:hypothetical protein
MYWYEGKKVRTSGGAGRAFKGRRLFTEVMSGAENHSVRVTHRSDSLTGGNAMNTALTDGDGVIVETVVPSIML